MKTRHFGFRLEQAASVGVVALGMLLITSCKPDNAAQTGEGSPSSPSPQGNASIPDVYGLYLKDGNVLHRLDRREAGFPDSFSANTSFLLFDRRLGSASIDPLELLTVSQQLQVRYNLEHQRVQNDKNPSESYAAVAVNDFVSLGAGPQFDVKPVPMQKEMVEFIPVKGWQPGRYYAHSKVHNLRIPFGIRSGTDTPVPARKVDRTYETTIDHGFDWKNWAQTEQPHVGWTGDADRRGNVRNVQYHDTSVADQRYSAAIAKFDDVIAKSNYAHGARIIRMCRQTGRDSDALLEKLASAMVREAKELQASSKEMACVMAWRTMQTQPENQEAAKLYEALIEAISDKQKQTQTGVEQWHTNASTMGNPVFKSELVTEEIGIGVREKVDASMVLTDHFLTASTIAGDDLRAWLPDIVKFDSGTSWGLENVFPNEKRRTYYTLTVSCRLGTRHSSYTVGDRRGPNLTSFLTNQSPQDFTLKFKSEQDRDKVATAARSARDALIKDAPLTDANVRTQIVDGVIQHTIELDHYYWSPWVILPTRLEKVEFSGEQALVQLDGQDAEYETLSDQVIRTTGRDRVSLRAGQRIRFSPKGYPGGPKSTILTVHLP